MVNHPKDINIWFKVQIYKTVKQKYLNSKGVSEREYQIKQKNLHAVVEDSDKAGHRNHCGKEIPWTMPKKALFLLSCHLYCFKILLMSEDSLRSANAGKCW